MKGYDQFFTRAKQAKGLGGGVKQGPKPQASTSVSAQLTPEEQVKELLAKKLRARRKKLKRKSRPPLGAVIFAILGLLVAAWGSMDPTFTDKISQHLEVSWLATAEAEGGAEESAETKGDAAANSSAAKRTEASVKTDEMKNWTPEDISHFSKLNERKKELDMREAELNELEEELHKQKIEIEARIRKLEEMRSQIAGILKDKVQMDDEKVGKLVDLYSNMKAKQAAEIIDNMNEDLAVEILSRMKKKNAAEIMNLLKAEKAQVLTEKFAGYKRR